MDLDIRALHGAADHHTIMDKSTESCFGSLHRSLQCNCAFIDLFPTSTTVSGHGSCQRGALTRKSLSKIKTAGKFRQFFSFLPMDQAGINPVIRIRINKARIGYNSAYTDKIIVVPNTL